MNLNIFISNKNGIKLYKRINYKTNFNKYKIKIGITFFFNQILFKIFFEKFFLFN